MTTTLFKSRTDLDRPRSAAFDAKDTDILYISTKRKVCKYRFSTNEVTLITGEPTLPLTFSVSVQILSNEVTLITRELTPHPTFSHPPLRKICKMRLYWR